MKLLDTLYIQSNKIKDPTVLEEIFMKMGIKVLYFQNNEAVRGIKDYRKVVISSLPTLTYLDERPVFDEDRRFAEAYTKGGREGEKEERTRWEQERRDKHLKYLSDFNDMVSKHKVQRDTPTTSVLDDIKLTEEQEQNIHKLAFSKSTTTEEHLSKKCEYS